MTDKVTRRKKTADTTPLYVEIETALRTRLDAQLERSGRSLTREVTWALEAWLTEQEKAAKKGGGR